MFRCFTNCKLIVGLNQFGDNSFDLTLRGHPDSFADLNLGADQLGNPDLWRGDWGDLRRGFRPWYWPNLFEALRAFDKRVEEIRARLDEPICEVLGFDPDVFRILPRAVVQFIGKDKDEESSQTTFREFVTESGNGLKPKDATISDEQVLARVGAARISKWLERCVLPEQDILVDAPHLVSRYPSLIDGDRKKIGTWNKTAQLIGHHQLGLNSESIEPYRFNKDHWISRPGVVLGQTPRTWTNQGTNGTLADCQNPTGCFAKMPRGFTGETVAGSSSRTPLPHSPDGLPRVLMASIIDLGFGFRCDFLVERNGKRNNNVETNPHTFVQNSRICLDS